MIHHDRSAVGWVSDTIDQLSDESPIPDWRRSVPVDGGRAMRNRSISSLALAAMFGLALLTMSCVGLGLAARGGQLPAIDWAIPVGDYHVLLVHNGPTFSCSPHALHDSCRPRQVRYEFYLHYISPYGHRLLVSFQTQAPEN